MRLRGITVLLVEDDPDNLELMASYFDSEGARTLSANSIAAARAATVERVDVLVSDLELPDGDGCTLVSELRERDGLQQVPAIAITGYSQQKWRDKAKSGGLCATRSNRSRSIPSSPGSPSSRAPPRAACAGRLRRLR